MKYLAIFALFFSLVLTGTAKEFGSKDEGFFIQTPDDWKTSSVLSAFVGKSIGTDAEALSKLTAFKGSATKPLILNIFKFASEDNLEFNRNATVDALSKDPQTKGGIQTSSVKLNGRNAARLEYTRNSGHRLIQFIVVDSGTMWSLFFIGPQDMTQATKAELDQIANSFRIPEKENQ